MDYQTSVDDHQTNGYSYDSLRNLENRVLNCNFRSQKIFLEERIFVYR